MRRSLILDPQSVASPRKESRERQLGQKSCIVFVKRKKERKREKLVRKKYLTLLTVTVGSQENHQSLLFDILQPFPGAYTTKQSKAKAPARKAKAKAEKASQPAKSVSSVIVCLDNQETRKLAAAKKNLEHPSSAASWFHDQE